MINTIMLKFFILAFFVLILLAIALPKSKAVSLFLILFMWVLYGCNTYSGDFIAYEKVFENIEQLKFHYEPAFSLLMLICHRSGLPFYGFRMVLSTIFLSLLVFTVVRNTQYIALTLAIFCLGPFFFFASVLRAGIAGLIIVNACMHLVGQKEHALAKFIILIFLATMFHYTSLVFLVLMFDKLFSKKIMFIMLVLASIFLYVLLMHGEDVIILLSRYTDREKTLEWFSLITNISTLNTIGKITGVAVIFGYALATNQLKNQYVYEKYYEQENNSNDNIIIVSERVSYILIILAPFMVVSDVLLRFFWEIQLLVIIGSVNVIAPPAHNNLFTKRVTFPEILFILCNLFVFYKLGSLGTVIEFMSNNFVFSGL